ncbi:MAG: acyl-CoA dehydrogenase family protein [Deltaproteobacteria bacterium]|nr:acyl-CoA dehydrogenase family protein [Deltaproteobacteria bacterium]
MDFALTKEEELIQKAAREFAEKVVEPLAERIDRNNEMPAEVMEGLADLGMFGITMPEAYGGGDAGHLCYALALEQLSKACAGIGMLVSVHSIGNSIIYKFGTDEQKKRYLPKAATGEHIFSFAFTEPGTGSDPKQLATTARREGGCYYINGTKRFISNAGYKGALIVIAKEDGGDITAFLLDKHCEGYSVSEPWNKIGVHGGQLYDVYLKDVKVPQENILGKNGEGFSILKSAMIYGKLGLAAQFLGITLAAYEEGLAYAKNKTHRGEAIVKFQHVQQAIADMAMKYDASMLYVRHLAWVVDNVKDPMLQIKEAAFTKLFSVETAVDVCRISMSVHGSYGCMNDYKISRLWRDAILGPQVEGTVNMLKIMGASVILRG